MFSKDELKAMMKESGKDVWTLVDEFEKTLETASRELKAEKEAEKAKQEKKNQKIEDCAEDVIISIGNFLEATGDAKLCARADRLLACDPEEMVDTVKVLISTFAAIDAITQEIDNISNKESAGEASHSSNFFTDIMKALLF